MSNKLLYGFTLALLFVSNSKADTLITHGGWNISVGDDNTLTLAYNEKVILNNAYAAVTYNILGSEVEKTISSADGTLTPIVSNADVDDCFGKGTAYMLEYRNDGGIMTQTFSFYDDFPYMIVQVCVESEDGNTVQSRLLTALGSSTKSRPLDGAANRMLYVPFDNDGNQQARFLTSK